MLEPEGKAGGAQWQPEMVLIPREWRIADKRGSDLLRLEGNPLRKEMRCRERGERAFPHNSIIRGQGQNVASYSKRE